MSELVIAGVLTRVNGRYIADQDWGESIPCRTCVIAGQSQMLIWIVHRRLVLPVVWMRVRRQVQGNSWSYPVTLLTAPHRPQQSATETEALHQHTRYHKYQIKSVSY